MVYSGDLKNGVAKARSGAVVFAMESVMFEAQCPHCRAIVDVPWNYRGASVRCLSCGEGFLAEEYLQPEIAAPAPPAAVPKPRAKPINLPLTVSLGIAGTIGLFIWLIIIGEPVRETAAKRVESRGYPIGDSESEKRFIREGMKMQELCGSGVSLDRFSEELTELKVEYRLAEKDMERDSFLQCAVFAAAINTWDGTREVWRRKIKGWYMGTLEDNQWAIEAVGWGPWDGGEFPEEVRTKGEYDGRFALDPNKLIRFGLGRGSLMFQQALDYYGKR
jgi:hypothetical protein